MNSPLDSFPRNREVIGRFFLVVNGWMTQPWSKVIRMKKPFGFEFLAVLVVLMVGMGWFSYQMLTEASQTEPRVMLINDKIRATYDVEYGRIKDLTLRLDVYQPTAWKITARPAILMIHGGAWIEGDKAGESELATTLVPEGIVAFAINYRLAQNGEGVYPAALLDVRRAVRWVRAHAREYGVDPDRIGAVGWSAGGHLACLLGTTDAPDPADPNSAEFSSRVNCVVDTAGPTDFTDESSPPLGVGMDRILPTFLGGPLSEIPATYREVSPIAHVDSRTAPTLILHGTIDNVVPVAQSRRFATALREAKVEVHYVEMPDARHGFDQPDNHERWVAEIAGFLINHLQP